MELEFNKYHGAGNDFIMFDGFHQHFDLSAAEVERFCDRHFGIGADGLIIIKKKEGYDFEMIYYNSDGLPGSMCGNGGRCAVAFAFSKGYLKESSEFLAVDGPHRAKVLSPGFISLHMNDVNAIQQAGSDYILNTGSPHFVRFVKDLKNLDVVKEGRLIRYSDAYHKEGINVNFVEWLDQVLCVRTYERGVEDETLSCGTGVTAAALVAETVGKSDTAGIINIETKGGALRVRFGRIKNGFTDIWLEGPAVNVFNGRINI